MREACGAGQRKHFVKNAPGPPGAIAFIEPEEPLLQAGKSGSSEKFVEQLMNPPLKRAIFGAEAVRFDFCRQQWHAGKQIVCLHPPREPGFELRLAAEFIYEVAIVVEDGAVANDIRGIARCVQFGRNLRVQNPELAFERGGGVHGKGRASRDFRNELHVFARLLHARADFVGEGGFSDAVRSNQREFQIPPPSEQASSFLT